MAASDQNYRSQNTLDIVFAVSSILMLVSVLWMLMQDYYREFKTEQRSFRDVEAAVAQRLAVADLPGDEEFATAEEAVKVARKERENNQKEIDDIKNKMAAIQPKKELSEKSFQDVKAVLESKVSFYNIAVDEHGVEYAEKKYRGDIDQLDKETRDAKAVRDNYVDQLKELQSQLERYEAPLTEAQSAWKKVVDRFETQAKLAINKQWTLGDTIRTLPVIDGFASPVKIQQLTIKDVPIDYNFLQVTRYDRCTTCHLGIDRPAYTKEMLHSLKSVSGDQTDKLWQAKARLKERRAALAGTADARNVPDPKQLRMTTLPKDELTEARVNAFCAHPRLELFVGANSKHPAEKFGCTSCHAGQGSGTSFNLVSHSPNNTEAKNRWVQEHSWESNHMWDFPMLPQRFIESSCVKCHHDMTDLYSANNRNEAPKVLRGYNLLKDNGCFGCHEIQGRKSGRQVGPDIRLESNPPLEVLPAAERSRIEADVDNLPGKERKVGPSLFRLAEKTNKEWTTRWLRAPREFRPDTKMPHFYGLANNHPDYLPTEQKKFPDAEMHAISHYLFEASNSHLKELSLLHKQDAAARDKEQARLLNLLSLTKPNDKEKTELMKLEKRAQFRASPPLVDLAAGYKGNPEKGRQLFTERGCLACHSHQGTEVTQGAPTKENYAPAVVSDAQFGPNLSQVAEKLGKKKGDRDSARIWLTQWIMNPHIHSPRSRMPVTHLDAHQATDLAEWLLSQEAQDLGKGWTETVVPEPELDTLKDLARVYLVRLLPRDVMKAVLENDQEKVPAGLIKDLPQEEQDLARGVNSGSLLTYLGKKAVGRLGCYACHDIPGFDNAKPIGVGLNDWGKKDAERLAFEDIAGFLKDHYYVVDKLTDAKDKPVGPITENGKTKLPYEKFFADALLHHSREGFLHQKIQEPRSYDYNRMLAWDDRSRMPQFKFARLRRQPKEMDEDFEARAFKAEADAREAVMTFVLGLVAEPLPAKTINQPSGDRLAEVKGRQILDKYNCGGCHLIQPGVFEFRVTPTTTKQLENALKIASGPDHVFPYHYNWKGKNPASPDKLVVQAVKPKFYDDDELDPKDPDFKQVSLRLAHAARFAEEKGFGDISAQFNVQIPIRSMIYPPPAAFASANNLKNFQRDKGPYGGAFADLLVRYLIEKDKGKVPVIYAPDPQGEDSSNARAAGPPILIGQGERTQADWLYQFLLEPQPVRRMSVLRMPKFNMGKDEAQALTAYFAAVERLQNTGTDLPFPSQAVPQQQDLDTDYWKAKTAAYVARLKSVKDEKGKTLFEQRVAELEPVWQQVLKDYESKLGHVKTQMEPVVAEVAAANKAVEKAKDEADKETDKTKKAELMIKLKVLQAAQKELNDKEGAWKSEAATLERGVANSSLKAQRQTWEESQAYLADAYRLVTNRQICLQCHQVGDVLPNQKITEGPPLALAHLRLRPDWTERWIASPQRFLTYPSVMPNNFPADKNRNYHDLGDKGTQFQHLFAGTSIEQVIAARDALMALPRAEAMPITRYLNLPLPGDKK